MIYEPYGGHKAGWVPNEAVMSWEIKELLKNKHNKLLNPKFPETLRENTEYKPFFYIKRPKCIHGVIQWPPKKGKKGKKKSPKSLA